VCPNHPKLDLDGLEWGASCSFSSTIPCWCARSRLARDVTEHINNELCSE